ncbi:hypothetical protein BZG36_02386 [Bifiguratus adelaidae]|uniref:PRP1 splicing factor N-terminal domain-containing protein n=1 Tax=Bifiguratus adelaidae TaxID=1938954 RepID=A0A261Y188_9FUNG|nr:hypothetical protein BZG36_02386 [Bifiguratus adelaidae]
MFGVTKDFIGKPAPPGYIAGLGRGATGFTTRSDIGPAREAPTDLESLQKAALEKRRAEGDEGEDDDERFQDPDNEVGLFSGAPYEEDDEEADRIWDQIDAKMDERRKARREAREKQELEQFRKERPKISEQFSDIKRSLANVSVDEWQNLPEVGDLTGKNKRRPKLPERFTPVPDSVLAAARNQNQMVTTPADSGMTTNFVEIGQARERVLGVRLDQMSDSVSSQTNIDPKGYLTDLNSIVVKSAAEIGDLKKARLLLNSVTQTNPKHAPGWIAAARLEEFAGKMTAARAKIAKGCEECPKSEDVWLEAARLNNKDNAKIILADAVRHNPESVKIWLKAVDLENDPKAQKRVIWRALEFIPNSVKLWRTAVNMEETAAGAKTLLSRAVELVPTNVDLWLALARLETYENGKKVLNKARSANPNSHEVWIAAARLEESQGKDDMVDRIIQMAVNKLSLTGSVLDREQWLKEAEKAEQDGSIVTAQAIVRATIGMGIEDEDRKKTWMEDAESCISHGTIATARAIYAHALKVFPGKKSIWRRAAYLEKSYGTAESLDELLKRAVTYCPQAEVLWLMGAKEKWLAGKVSEAQAILEEAFKANPNSEQIWLAAVKLESENGEYERARFLLQRARDQSGTERVWMKSVVLERQMKHFDTALELLQEALEKYPTFDKLWMIQGQIYDMDLSDMAKAREVYAKGVKNCPKSITLWILSARLEEKAGVLIRARSILEKARYMNPKTPELWVEAIRVELRANQAAAAKALGAKALQECPSSGLLWSELIFLEPRPQRKSRSVDALKKCEHDALVVCAVARLFWSERKVDKARSWFAKAVKIDSDLGDVWAWWYKFELQHGTEEERKALVDACVRAEPHHGEVWQQQAKDMSHVGWKTVDILLATSAALGENQTATAA